MIRIIFLCLSCIIVSCSSNNQIDTAKEYKNKVNETESRFDKLYEDLDRETK